MATTPNIPADRDLVEAILETEAAEEEFLAAESWRKKTRDALVNLMAMREEHETTVDGTSIGADGIGFKVRVMSSERTTVYDDVLIGIIGKRAYNKLTERKASKDKILEAIRSGELDPATVSPAIEVKTTTAWPKIDRYVPEDS